MVSFSRKGAAQEAEVQEAGTTMVAPVADAPVAPASAPHAAFPRVNLIPDEIAQEARVRRSKMVLGGTVAASVLAVGGLYFVAVGSVGSAQEQLDTATAHSAALAAEAAKYADVPKVKSDLAAAQTQQASAMAGEVRWSFVLNNLSLTMPQGTSLTGLKGTITGNGAAPAAAGTPTTTSNAVTSILGKPGVGSLQFEGEALNDAHVASFLESLARSAGLTDPFATQASSDDSASTTATPTPASQTVRFTATTTIGPKALSHRYDMKGN